MATGLPAGRTKANQEWVIDFSNFRAAWSTKPKSNGKALGEGIYIAHPDTGYTNHPELKTSRYIKDEKLSRNFLKPKRIARDDLLISTPLGLRHPSHGTSTASVIISPRGHHQHSISNPELATEPAEDPKAFVSGVAPKSNVIPLRVTTSVILTKTSGAALAKAILHCIKLQKQPNPIDVAVISISLGMTSQKFEPLRRVLSAARQNGIVTIAAAGQTPRLVPQFVPVYPGSSVDTICVAACDHTGAALKSGLYGANVDITAPGVDVWCAKSSRIGRFKDSFTVYQSSGTSYATALTAGACALWQAHHGRNNLIKIYGKDLIFKLFRYCLRKSAHQPDSTWDGDNTRGAGILDVKALLDFKLPSKRIIDGAIF